MKVELTDVKYTVYKPQDLWTQWADSQEFSREPGSFSTWVNGHITSGAYTYMVDGKVLSIQSYIHGEQHYLYRQTKRRLIREYKGKKHQKEHKPRTMLASEYANSQELKNDIRDRLSEKPEYMRLTAPTAGEDQFIRKNYNEYVKAVKERWLHKCTEFEADELDRMTAQDVYDFFAVVDAETLIDHKNLSGYLRRSISQILRISPQLYLTEFGATPAVQIRKLAEGIQAAELFEMLMPADWENDYLLGTIKCAAYFDRYPSDHKRSRRILKEYFTWAGIDAVLEEYALSWADSEMNQEFIFTALRKNRMYQRVLGEYWEEVSRRERIQAEILKQIPEDFVDLYPAARTMFRHFVLHIGPTNSGKSYESLQAFCEAETGVYLAPLRLLAYEVYESTNASGVLCNMITGEEMKLVEGARHVASTIEMLNLENHYSVAVIDEAQMLEDEERGGSWTSAIMGVCADVIHVCAAPHARKILISLIEDCGDSWELVEHNRKAPISFERNRFQFPQSVRKNDALIVFSKKAVIACAAVLQKDGWRVSTIYGALPYDVRQKEVQKLGIETDVVVATDAIGMGLNLPIERVVFLQTRKFDGHRNRFLNAAEVQQIAGRAGRMGVFSCGFYTSEFNSGIIHKLYRSGVPDIQHVKVEFPRTLISVEGRLSELMEQWSRIPSHGIYEIGGVLTQIKLCKELESYTDDKQLIYRFVTIPYEERNQDLHELWLNLFESVHEGKGFDAQVYFEELSENITLEELEYLYKVYDLLYYYYRINSDTAGQNQVSLRKADISERITRLLSEQKLPERKCECCGKTLPWDSEYKFCDRCFRA